MTVVVAFELDDLVASGIATCQANRGHGGLGTRVDHAHHLDAGHHLADQIGHFGLDGGRRAEGETGINALAHSSEDIGIGMAGDHGSPGSHVIDITLAFHIEQISALARSMKTGGRSSP